MKKLIMLELCKKIMMMWKINNDVYSDDNL